MIAVAVVAVAAAALDLFVAVVVLLSLVDVPVMDRRSLAASFHLGLLLGLLLLLGMLRRSGGLDVEDVLLLLLMPRQLTSVIVALHWTLQPASLPEDIMGTSGTKGMSTSCSLSFREVALLVPSPSPMYTGEAPTRGLPLIQICLYSQLETIFIL